MRTIFLFPALASLALACGDNETRVRDYAAYPAGGQNGTPQCTPNLDGKIEFAEFAIVADSPARVIASPPGTERTVNVAGLVDTSGAHVWNYGADYADDRAAAIVPKVIAGKWYADRFPSGQYVIPIDTGATIEGVYSQDTDAIRLHGYASADENASGKMLVVYTTPVDVYRYPLQVGAEWTSVGEFKNATFLGVPNTGTDTYVIKVDADGQMILPEISLTKVLRVRSNLTTELLVGGTFNRRRVFFLNECIGEVARVTSKLNEPLEDFTTAEEFRRLGL